MKLIHLSDLHLGKRVNGFSMLEEQSYILEEIIRIIDTEQPDGILIAGDIYDKGVPPAEAVTLLDDFLVQLAQRGLMVILISGNHDSPERVSFGGRLMEHSGIYFAPVYNGAVTPVTLSDSFGPVKIYPLPFLKPAVVRSFFPDANIENYTDALSVSIQAMNVDTGIRNVLVAHQFVTGAKTCDSEGISIGGLDNTDVSVFAPFDYVALGHLHGPQSIGRDTVRYCGTPLKYSFSEVSHQKSVTVAELGAKGEVTIRTVPLVPRRDWREIEGSYMELTDRNYYAGTDLQEDYLHVTLTDESDIPDAVRKLRTIYHNLMVLEYRRAGAEGVSSGVEEIEQKSPMELLEEFYYRQNGCSMDDEQRTYAIRLLESIREEEETQ